MKQTILIRKGKIKEISQLWEIEKESANYHKKIIPKKYHKFEEYAVKSPAKKSFIKNFEQSMKEEGSFFLVAEDNKRIVGYLSVDLFYAISSKRWIKCIHIEELGILNKYSRQGIATKLIKYLEEISKEKNYKFISLNVKSKNIPAINLYKKNKFGIYDVRLVKEIK